ncbi:MAG: dTDP-4-dehydrorhamnose 3,5-epimerase [Eggerthellaceae bacterium]|nr:dTDP-4-dehydrorhamnose 3,5-epimerase [Eggerthellaceae bacterium]
MNFKKTIKTRNFKFQHTEIPGLIVVDVLAFGDERGYFLETYKQADFAEGGIDVDFVQDNQSRSTAHVLRGLHYQINHPQAKHVRVIKGSVYDVAVDLRQESPTFGCALGVELSEDNHRQFFIPRGFAHGFYVMSDSAVFAYKVDNVYYPNDEGGIIWNDLDLAVDWPIPSGVTPLLSEKDKVQKTFAEYKKDMSF